jgi:hypothetical protein
MIKFCVAVLLIPMMAVGGFAQQAVRVASPLPAGTNNIGDVDILSIVPGTGATALGKAIDTATGSTDTGVLILATRDDSLTTLTPSDGDNVQVRTDSVGRLWVNCGTGCSGGTQYTIGTAAGATDTVTLPGAIRDDALTTLSDPDGDYVALRVSSTGALWVASSTVDAAESAAVATPPVPIGGVHRTTPTTLADGDVGYPLFDTSSRIVVVGAGTAGTAAGGVMTIQGVASGTAVIVGDGSGALNVIVDSGTITTVTTVTAVTSVNAVIPGTGATNLGKAIDTATGATDTGVLALATRDDALTTLTPADGDNVQLRTNSTGALWVKSADLDAAESAAVATNPVPFGGVMRSSPVVLADGDVGYVRLDTNSYLYTRFIDPCSGVVKTYVPIDIVTATTVELANAVASEFFYICGVNLVSAGANAVVIAEDDTDTCSSISAGVTGGVTAAEGWTFAANGGNAMGNGLCTIAKTTTANRYLCILTSQAVQLSGSISFVSAP